MVSVPWVTTTPFAPSASRRSISPASAARSSKLREAPGTWRTSSTSTATPVSARPGTAATSWSADKAGTTPPVGPVVIAIVPPSPNTTTRRRAARITYGKWAELGHMVNFYADRTPPLAWNEVGECWAGTRHPVVEVESAL
jgi:hypothetical protein